jgi:hypothetical protein
MTISTIAGSSTRRALISSAGLVASAIGLVAAISDRASFTCSLT